MKRFLVVGLALATAAAFALTGCGNKAQESTPVPETKEAEVVVPGSSGGAEPVLGGWTITEEQTSNLSEEETARFDKAMEGQTGVNYTPIAIIGTQVVSGTNYQYLCLGTVVSPDGAPQWYIVTIYEDLNGGVELTGIADLDLTSLKTVSGAAGEATGAWAATEPGGKAVMLPDEMAQKAFDAVAEGDQIKYYPIALLATQVVAGTNYKVMAHGVSETAGNGIYVLTIYQDLEGNATLDNAEQLDLAAYAEAK